MCCTAYRNDPAFVPELDLVMVLDGEIIGQVIYRPLGDRLRRRTDACPIMTFGPIGIAPAVSSGRAMASTCWTTPWKKQRSWARVRWPSPEISCVYGKSGFVPAKTKGVRYADDPEADYLLIRELEPGFLNGISGTYRDPAGYFVCETGPEGFAQYEATFPPKEKRHLPGQLF